MNNNIKNKLRELENYTEFYNEIKKIIRNSGRSDHIHIREIEELLNKFSPKNLINNDEQ